MRPSFASDHEQPVPPAPAFMTIAIESGRNRGTGNVAWASFRAPLAGVVAIVGKTAINGNAAIGASSDTMAVLMPDLKRRRAPQLALR